MHVTPRVSRIRHVRRVVPRVIAFGMLLLLPACRIPSLRPGEPAPPVPATFNAETTPESSATLGVDEFYHDPLLRGLIYQALDNNQEPKALGEEFQIAANEVIARRAACPS